MCTILVDIHLGSLSTKKDHLVFSCSLRIHFLCFYVYAALVFFIQEIFEQFTLMQVCFAVGAYLIFVRFCMCYCNNDCC